MLRKKIPFIFLLFLFLACSGSSSSGKEMVSIHPFLSKTEDPLAGIDFIEVGVKVKGKTNQIQPNYYFFSPTDFQGKLMDSPEIPYNEKVMVYIKGYPKQENNPNMPADYPISSGRTTYFKVKEGDEPKDVYVLFSRVDSFTEIFNFQTGEKTSLIKPRVGQTVTRLQNGKVLIVGGAKLKDGVTSPFSPDAIEEIYQDAEIFDPATGTFTPVISGLNFKRAFHTATLMPDGKVVIAGGITEGGVPTNQVEIFDPVMESFQTLAPMQKTRAYHTATLVDIMTQSILFIGGRSTDGGTSTWEIYSVMDTNYNTSGNLKVPRYNHQALYVERGLPTEGDAVYIIGGENDTDVVDKMEIFNIYELNIVSGVDFSMQGGKRTLFGAVYNKNVKLIFVVGGFADKEKKNPLNTYEVIGIYINDPQFIQSKALRNLNFKRGGVSTILMPDNSLLVAGGFGVDENGNYVSVTKAERIEMVYNVNNGGAQIEVLPVKNELPQSVALPVLTLLDNDYVLITGGIGFNGSSLETSSQALFFNYDDTPIYTE